MPQYLFRSLEFLNGLSYMQFYSNIFVITIIFIIVIKIIMMMMRSRQDAGKNQGDARID